MAESIDRWRHDVYEDMHGIDGSGYTYKESAVRDLSGKLIETEGYYVDYEYPIDTQYSKKSIRCDLLIENRLVALECKLGRRGLKEFYTAIGQCKAYETEGYYTGIITPRLEYCPVRLINSENISVLKLDTDSLELESVGNGELPL